MATGSTRNFAATFQESFRLGTRSTNKDCWLRLRFSVQQHGATHDYPTIRANFAIVQSDENQLDEALWNDIASFDVEISRLEEFSNVRVHFIPLPFAEIVGFATGSYLVQFFRGEMGITPSKFRREMRVG